VSERVVLVIGGSSGIGRAAALRFAARGARLVLMARNDTALADAAEQCRAAGAGEVSVVAGDAAVRADVEKAVDTALAEHGALDVVVHTAALMAYGTLEAVPEEVFDAVVSTAVKGAVNLARVVVPVLRRQGHGTIVAVNSLLGSVTVPNMGAYSVSKWGQRAALRTLQQEVRDLPDVHVCIVSPGSLNTPIYYKAANYTGKGARPPWPVLSPERAAEVIVGLADRPRDHTSVPLGPFNPVIVAGFRLLPFVYDRIVGPLFSLAAQTRRSIEATAGSVLQPRPGDDRVHGHWPDRSP
jgi:NAD(P)-dependent dehydrogenase (short-subunit alcohol dehydrogenase family)